MEQDTKAAVIVLMQLVGHVIARVEALQSALIRGGAVTAESIAEARLETDRKLERNTAWLGNPIFDRDFGSSLKETAGRLKAGLR